MPEILSALIGLHRKDGGVSILAIPIDASGIVDAAVVESEIARWMTSLGPDLDAWTPIVGWRRVERDEIPVDREFRNALTEHPTDGLVHDLEKAKTIAVARVRELRNIALSALDVRWQSALGQKDASTADLIEAQRQVLREQPNVLTAALAGATSIDNIRATVAANKTATESAQAAIEPTPGVSGSGNVIG